MLASFTMSISCECGRSKIRGRACQRRDIRGLVNPFSDIP
jgi:hypothetical protein